MVRKRKKKIKQRVWGHRPLFVILAFSTFSLTLLIGALMVGYLLLGLPEISGLESYAPPAVTEVLDADGNPIAYWYKEKRWPLARNQIPEVLIKAFVAAEDARFYEHPGIDFMGVLRAILKNVEAGTIVQGASTITQQVTRSLLLSSERSWVRKIKEAILAWQIDAKLTKDEILTIYLNQIYLGQGAYGVEAAARTYFAKHAKDLSLAECALLAGLPQAPSRYNPAKHLDRAKRRQEYALRRMVEEGYITKEQAEKALKEPIIIKRKKLVTPPGTSYFLSELRKELEARYGRKRLLTDGLTIISTFKSSWQQRAVDAMKKGVDALLKRHPREKALRRQIQGALVAMDVETGAVRAMIGGLDFKKSQFNRATQARIQPGSSFKPIVYTAAMAKGLIAPNSILVDDPISLPGPDPTHPWEPENFDKTYMGPITIRTALTHSRNIISVKIARMTGLKAIHSMARKMGITVPLANNLSIALGSSGVPLIQLVQAYSTFPNLGQTVTPQFIQEIRDRRGRVIERLVPQKHKVLDPVVAYQMLHLLEGVVQEGTGRGARALGVPAAGKTGTTDNYRDALFLGFTPQVVCGVWVGREDRKPLGRLETGGRVACPIWTSFMEVTKKEMRHRSFDIPQGIAFVPVNRWNGTIVSPKAKKSREIIWEALREDSLPPLHPSSGFLNLPSWFKKLDGILFNRQ